ncbi:MAG: universal stress protein UspE [Succinivibrionaceae bacterium]
MKNYRNIIVVLDAGGINEKTLEKALYLARLDPKTKITVFLPVFDFSIVLSSVMAFPNKEELLTKVIEAKEAEIETAIASQGISNNNISVKVVWGRSQGGALGRELKTGNYDLIVKTACQESDPLASFFFTPVDWKLMRKAQVPVILVKDKPWRTGGVILVAVCYTEKGFENRVNLKLLREAQILSLLTGSVIHLVNAVPCPAASVSLDVPGFLPDTYNEAIKEEHIRKLNEFALNHKLAPEQLHTVSGLPEEVIPDTARKMDATAVLMGSLGRDGFSGTVIGNTAEMIIDELDCDMIVLKTPEELFLED